jgi:sucrose-6-phosphate hydrolase SacC (GH32 family)
LRDSEVTVGEIRDWNRKPVLIGAQYKQSSGYSASSDNDAENKYKGFIDHVVLWNRYLTASEIQKLSGVTELKEGRPEYYTEKYRPQFHFSAKKNWLNDPNGLVYYKGIYHLFFQYMPPHRPGAYKDWGHAVSTDLIHWEQTDDHITPHRVWGGCWSGSAVVDVTNSAGFQNGDEKTIVAFITNGGEPNRGWGTMCTQ